MPTIPMIRLNDGNAMPQVGFGVWRVSNEEAKSAVAGAIEAGYRSIDTASIYGNEEGVGEAIRSTPIAREELFITTKVWNDRQGYDSTLRAFDESLARLRLEHVDLYLIHWPMVGSEAYRDTWRALIKLQQDGRAKSIGVSNFMVPHLQRVIDETGVTPAVNQIELHPRFQQKELSAFHKANGIVTECWGPLGQGKILSEDDLRHHRPQIRQDARSGHPALAPRQRLRGHSEIRDAVAHPREHRRLRLQARCGRHAGHRAPRQRLGPRRPRPGCVCLIKGTRCYRRLFAGSPVASNCL